jgi:hypothetical protein
LILKYEIPLVPTNVNESENLREETDIESKVGGPVASAFSKLNQVALENTDFDENFNAKGAIVHKRRNITADKKFCCRNCGVSYASKYYSQSKIHEHNCPTTAFLKSNWRPSSYSWLVENGYIFKHENIESIVLE